MSEQLGRSDPNKPGAETASTGAAGSIGDKIKNVGAQAAALASDTAGDLQTRGASLIGDLKDDASSAAEETKGQAAEGLDKLASELRRSSGAFEGQHDWLAKLVESGAGEIATLADALRTNDLKAMLGKVEEVARRQPAVFVGAAIAVGFGAARIGRLAAEGASSTTASTPQAPSTGVAHVAE